MSVITAKFGKCCKCGADLTGKRVNWDYVEKKISCLEECAIAATPAPAKVSLPLPSRKPVAPPAPKIVYVKLKRAFARSKSISMHLEGVIVRQTEKAIYFEGHTDARASVNCLHCGRFLENPVSRVFGYGPICIGKIGIIVDFPLDKATAQQLDELKNTIRNVKWEGWIPKSCATITDAPSEATAAGEEEEEEGNESPAPSPAAPANPLQRTTKELTDNSTDRYDALEMSGNPYTEIHTDSYYMERKSTAKGQGYSKLRRRGGDKTRWEGFNKVDESGNILESLYKPHPEGLF